jgi:hypothetical protein
MRANRRMARLAGLPPHSTVTSKTNEQNQRAKPTSKTNEQNQRAKQSLLEL